MAHGQHATWKHHAFRKVPNLSREFARPPEGGASCPALVTTRHGKFRPSRRKRPHPAGITSAQVYHRVQTFIQLRASKLAM